MTMTEDDKKDFINSTICHICEQPLVEGEERVKDHCHLTGIKNVYSR